MFFDHIFTDLLEGICVCEYLLEGTFVFELFVQKCTVRMYISNILTPNCSLLEQLVAF